MSYDILLLDQYWFRCWPVTWQHPTITWTNVGLPSLKYSGIQLKAITLKNIPDMVMEKDFMATVASWWQLLHHHTVSASGVITVVCIIVPSKHQFPPQYSQHMPHSSPAQVSYWLSVVSRESRFHNSIGQCKKDVTPLLMHRCYFFLASTNRLSIWTWLPLVWVQSLIHALPLSMLCSIQSSAIHQLLGARLQYLQCISTGDTAVLH